MGWGEIGGDVGQPPILGGIRLRGGLFMVSWDGRLRFSMRGGEAFVPMYRAQENVAGGSSKVLKSESQVSGSDFCSVGTWTLAQDLLGL